MKLSFKTITVAAFLLTLNFELQVLNSFAQCDTTAIACQKKLSSQYLSDGQQYRALLVNSEAAEFTTTFYGGNTYRIVAGSGLNADNVFFRLYDSEHHLLFNNSEYKNTSFWDFKFTSTVNCTIEAQLANAPADSKSKDVSGCAVLLVGFKHNSK